MEKFAIVVACLCTIFVMMFIEKSSAQSCTKRASSNCICDFTDPSGVITSVDLTKLANTDNKPAFDYKTADQPAGTDFQYAYNPCFPFIDTASGIACNGVAVCQRNSAGTLHYDLGDPTSAAFSSDGKTITYTSPARKTDVQLKCDQNANNPSYRAIGQEDPTQNVYKLEITSCHCCNGGCTKSPIPGLSFGSVLCILFVVLLIVYCVGGVVFQRYARGASGKEVIPNVSFWQEFPLLVKDGFVFVASGCGFRQQDDAYESI